MKKNLLLLFVSVVLLSCGTARGGQTSDEQGVVIDGVRWATRNVNTPGTFAASPESAGMFYQWNSRTAWSATGEVADWNAANATGDSWERANDPCPQGWRVPTEDELTALAEMGGTWATRNGVDGKIFGTAPNQIFLPAAGWRANSNGALNGIDTRGSYWSGGSAAATTGRGMGFAVGYSNMTSGPRALGRPVRCVAIN